MEDALGIVFDQGGFTMFDLAGVGDLSGVSGRSVLL